MDLQTRIQTLRRRRMSNHVIAAILDLDPDDVAAIELNPAAAADVTVPYPTPVAGQFAFLRASGDPIAVDTDDTGGFIDFGEDVFSSDDGSGFAARSEGAVDGITVTEPGIYWISARVGQGSFANEEGDYTFARVEYDDNDDTDYNPWSTGGFVVGNPPLPEETGFVATASVVPFTIGLQIETMVDGTLNQPAIMVVKLGEVDTES